jgi:hypothetical protein
MIPAPRPVNKGLQGEVPVDRMPEGCREIYQPQGEKREGISSTLSSWSRSSQQQPLRMQTRGCRIYIRLGLEPCHRRYPQMGQCGPDVWLAQRAGSEFHPDDPLSNESALGRSDQVCADPCLAGNVYAHVLSVIYLSATRYKSVTHKALRERGHRLVRQMRSLTPARITRLCRPCRSRTRAVAIEPHVTGNGARLSDQNICPNNLHHL